MRGGALEPERRAAILAVDGVSFAEAWAWEKQAQPGAYCAEAVCLGHARTSDVLILILGADLSSITEKEYQAAAGAEVQRIILVKEGVRRRRAATDFLNRERATVATTKNFQNIAELRTHIVSSLEFHAVQSSRHAQLARLNATTRPGVLKRMQRRR